MCALKDEIKVQMQENQVCTDSSDNLVGVISVLKNPFSGLETTWKQNKYCKKKGVFCTTYILDKFVSCSCKERTAAKSHKKCNRFVPQKLVIEQFMCLLGVLKSIITYMESGDGHLICDFHDGQLWQQHPFVYVT